MTQHTFHNPALSELARTAAHIRKNPPATKAAMEHALTVFGSALEQFANWSEHARPVLRFHEKPKALDNLEKICGGLAMHLEADALTASFLTSAMDAIETIAIELDALSEALRIDACARANNVIRFPLERVWPACAQPSSGPYDGGDRA